MASASDGAESEARSVDGNGKGSQTEDDHSTTTEAEDEEAEEDEGTDNEDDSEGEEEEPMLKYASLTKGQGSIYRNGDAASAFLVAGDKMIIGTHNGYIHVHSLPSFQSLRAYRAHSASVSSISTSPFPPPLTTGRADVVKKPAAEAPDQRPQPGPQSASARTGRQQTPVPNIPSNAIHIATSSIDGNVCVFSLTDVKDVLLRNFGRPVQSVALSPDYKNDRSYLSGGLSGNLILTVGGRAGSSANANTSGAAAAAAGWLNTIGIGGHNGTDTVLHSGEGIIHTIKYSLSGRYVAWVNEKGIKIMRSNLHLDSHESELAWKRMGHIDRPSRAGWEEMAGMWKSRAEWIDEDGLEESSRDDPRMKSEVSQKGSKDESTVPVQSTSRTVQTDSTVQKEKLIVGWGDFIWIIDVHPGGIGARKNVGERSMGRIEIITKLRTDCIVSGVSLYTPKLIIVLAYVTPNSAQDNNDNKASLPKSPRRGIQRRLNAQQPEMRIIDTSTHEEVSVADTLQVSRYESLAATDYHLGVLPVARDRGKAEAHRGALEVIGDMGGSIWDAAMYPTRLFGSNASIRSHGSASGRLTGSQASTSDTSNGQFKVGQGPHPALLTRGMKIFIQSPYDCVLATKPSLSDHLKWLDEHEKYEEAWKLLDTHPESAGGLSHRDSGGSTPTTAQDTANLQTSHGHASLIEFFEDDSSRTTTSQEVNKNSIASKEKRRIGGKWIQHLVNRGQWDVAGETCGLVLENATSWEHWVWMFAETNKFEEITPYIPSEQLRPPISSTVYEVVLGHYISKDRVKLGELLQKWPPELYDVSSIISAIESRLNAGDINEASSEDGETGRDWRILMDGLARLYLADGRAQNALRCYVKLQDADAAMALIASHHLIDTVADDISGLILLRVSKQQQKSAPLPELEEASLEPIRLLVSEAHHGIVKPETVISQLNGQQGMRPFLFLYMRALWNGDTVDTTSARRSRFDVVTNPLAAEGRTLVNDSADTALTLFAEYDRDLLFEFLRSSQSYTLSTATSICEKRSYTPELVYLLAKEGQTKRALRVIIEKLGDVSGAILFAKEQDDPELWNDLLNYSMNKPAFIRALLEEVGTAIDPIALVRRIPEGLEITGLRDALIRMIKEYELQDSISDGVMRVFRSEVAVGMTKLRSGQKKGVRFDIVYDEQRTKSRDLDIARTQIRSHEIKVGYCCGCGELIFEGALDPLMSFPCTHTFHLSCYLTYNSNTPPTPDTQIFESSKEADINPTKLTTFPAVEDPMDGTDPDDFSGGIDYGIGPKVRFAKDLRNTGKVKPGTGCPLEIHQHDESAEG